MNSPRPDSSSRPTDGDEAIDEDRRAVDQERTERREVHDRTRQHSRGNQQTRAGLDRERALDDASLESERRVADLSRANERRRLGQESRQQAAQLEAAEDSLDAARLAQDAAGLERREMLRVADAELADLGAALTKLQARTAGTGLELSPEVDAALACAGRLARALAQALDAEDLRGEHHDLGGSG